MVRLVRLELRLIVTDDDHEQVVYDRIARWAASILRQEQVTATGSAFTALSAPSGAKWVLIDPGSAVGLTLKGVTGDTGVAVVPSSNPITAPLLLPLGSAPSLGLANAGSSATVEVIWL